MARAGCAGAAQAHTHTHIRAVHAALPAPRSHVERTLETFCNMNLEMQETQNISKINKQAGGGSRGLVATGVRAEGS